MTRGRTILSARVMVFHQLLARWRKRDSGCMCVGIQLVTHVAVQDVSCVRMRISERACHRPANDTRPWLGPSRCITRCSIRLTAMSDTNVSATFTMLTANVAQIGWDGNKAAIMFKRFAHSAEPHYRYVKAVY